MSRARLIIVQNHKYEAVLPKLRELYKDRFPDYLCLVPFYRGTDAHAVPVYASSHHFQSFFAQAIDRIERPGFSHYVFSADDLLLNPSLDTNNFCDSLGLHVDAAYISELSDPTQYGLQWLCRHRFIHPLRLLTPRKLRGRIGEWLKGPFDELRTDVEWHSDLPPAPMAERHLNRHGIRYNKLSLMNLWATKIPAFVDSLLLGLALSFAVPRQLPYPVAVGYSDIVVVPAAALRSFCHLCGVFGALGLFVEIAIPTALALTCPRILTEESTDWDSRVIWGRENVRRFEERYGHCLSRLAADLGVNTLFAHPVKLSKWS